MMRAWGLWALVAAGCAEAPPSPLPEYVDLQLPAVEIPAGTERMYCYFVDNEHGDLAIDHTLGEQGPGGHHLALKASPIRRPSGTFEDCTTSEASLDLHDVHFGGNLPEHGALLIPGGAQLVVQTHYVNSTEAPLVVKDLLRLHRHTVTESTRWMAALHLADDEVVVDRGHSTRTFSCAPEVETELVMLWGHMHGLGERFTISTGSEVIYEHAWQPAFEAQPPRLVADATPVVFRPDAPLSITCAWNNTSATALAFPEEMCGVGGYVLGTTPFWCSGTS